MSTTPESVIGVSSSERQLSLAEIVRDLRTDGWITEQQAQQLQFRVDQNPALERMHPLAIVADQGWMQANQPRFTLDIERLTRWLAERCGLDYVRIDPLKIDIGAVTGVIKQAYARRFGILPIDVRDDVVVVATAQPFIREWQRELESLLRRKFIRVVASPLAVQRYLGEFYAVSRSLDQATAEHERFGHSGHSNQEALVNLEQVSDQGDAQRSTDDSSALGEANEQHVVRLVDWLLQYAFEQRASDIHLEPRRELSSVRFRIDGQLHLVNQLATNVMQSVVSRLKALGRMDVIERRRPQDGRLKTRSPAGQEVELRLSTMPTAFGEKMVARIFDPDALIKPMSAFGFSDYEAQTWSRVSNESYGLIVVTGPTGSGKTTTLYSALKQLSRPEINICTIEDPIELVEIEFNQMSVQPQLGVDFANGVRTLLRQDPDIIMVGEIRDAETAATAVQAALTGHLVFTTLHTNDAPSAITRLLDLGVAPYLLKAATTAVLAQRLIRTLCPHCRYETDVDVARWEALIGANDVALPERWWDADGCDECRHTGFYGRTGIFELMVMTDPMRELVTDATDVGSLRAQARFEGMRSLRLGAAEKVTLGVTTVNEAMRVIQTQ